MKSCKAFDRRLDRSPPDKAPWTVQIKGKPHRIAQSRFESHAPLPGGAYILYVTGECGSRSCVGFRHPPAAAVTQPAGVERETRRWTHADARAPFDSDSNARFAASAGSCSDGSKA